MEAAFFRSDANGLWRVLGATDIGEWGMKLLSTFYFLSMILISALAVIILRLSGFTLLEAEKYQLTHMAMM